MRNISDTTRSISDKQTPGKDRDLTSSFTGEGYKSVVEKANSVSIKQVFMMYGIRLDENNRKTTCPFKSHKGGRETTASFYFYPDTNTYFCYGCRQGSKPVDFVLNMDKSTKLKAAQKILENFNIESSDEFIINNDDFHDRLSIIIEYSNEVRNFRLNFTNEPDLIFIENNCKILDTITSKYDLNNEALKSVVSQLIDAINKYNP